MLNYEYPEFNFAAPLEYAVRFGENEPKNQIYRTDFMRDRDRVLYISITDGKGQDVEIEDNRNSYFYTIGDSYALADETFSMYTYYAYICDLDETYQLTVNGEAFPVF